MAKEPMIEVTEGRTCGECRMCCKVLSVHERKAEGSAPVFEQAEDGSWHFHKPMGKWCQFSTKGSGPGCSVYEERPYCCARFQCLWLAGAMGEEDRPDRSKVVLTGEETPHYGRLIIVYESYPGVLESKPRVQRWIEGALAAPTLDGVAVIPSATLPRRLLHKRMGREEAVPLVEQFTEAELTVDADAAALVDESGQ